MANKSQQVAAPAVQRAPMEVFRHDLLAMEKQFANTLPVHIPAERFGRVVLNAVQRTPRLMMCDRGSLWNACMQSAEDALLPDKREGAIVPFKKGQDDDGGSPGKAGDYVAVWIPMVLGIRKLVRQSGEISDLNVQLVYVDEFEQGAFKHELGDSPMLKHRRLAFAGDPAKRKVYCGYSIAWDKDRNLLVPEIMFENEIIAVGSRSKAYAKGPWSDALFSLEMRKKTVTKRHFKQLPTSRDLDRVLRRDDALYNFDAAGAVAKEQVQKIRGGAAGALQHFAGGSSPQPERVQVPQAEELAAEEEADRQEDGGDDRQDSKPAEQPKAETPAGKEGDHDETSGAKTAEQYAEGFRKFLKQAKTPQGIDARWKRDLPLRNKLANMTPELRGELEKERDARKAELSK